MEPLTGQDKPHFDKTPFCGIAPNKLFSWSQFRLLSQKSEFIREALYYLYKIKTATKSNANIVEVDRKESSFQEMFISQRKVRFLNFSPLFFILPTP